MLYAVFTYGCDYSLFEINVLKEKFIHFECKLVVKETFKNNSQTKLEKKLLSDFDNVH